MRRRKRALRRQNTFRLIAGGALLLGFAAFFYWLDARDVTKTPPEELASLGSTVYSANCAICHGEQGQGHAEVEQAPALDASEHAWHHPDGQLQEIITSGGIVMPGFGEKLSRQDVYAVIRYFQTWWQPEQLEIQQELSQQHPFR